MLFCPVSRLRWKPPAFMPGKERFSAGSPRAKEVCVRITLPSSVPQGRLNLAQDAVLGWVGRDA